MFRHLPPSVRLIGPIGILCLVCLLRPAQDAAAQVTLLVPSLPTLDAPPPSAPAKPARNGGKAAQAPRKAAQAAPAAQLRADRPAGGESGSQAAASAAPEAGAASAGRPEDAGTAPAERREEAGEIDREVDLLISLMRPTSYDILEMDAPRLLAVLRFSEKEDGGLRMERRDLLGDVEEIRFQGRRAWGANVAISRPGLHQFILEARPRWEEARRRFEQHFVKVVVPVHGADRGWNTPAGLPLEIIPLNRPFGLAAPCLFSARALRNGAVLADATVRLYRVNTEKMINMPTPWHEFSEARTDADGRFGFVLSRSGWWCCVVEDRGDPLRGPDGSPAPLLLGGVFWLYVDEVADRKR